MAARIYAACLASYNNGRLHGRWIDVTDPDTMQGEIAAMLAESPMPGAEEWAVHDYDGIHGNWGEHPDLEALYAFVEARDSLNHYGTKAFEIWYADHGGRTETDAEALADAFHDAYVGEFNSREDFGEHLIGDLIDEMLPEHLAPYFDTEAYAKDLLLTDYWEQDDHYFRHC